MTDHHIRIAFAVAGQAAFIFMYLMAIKETSHFKRDFVAWFGGVAWILFLFAANLFTAKSFIEYDREETKREIEEIRVETVYQDKLKIKRDHILKEFHKQDRQVKQLMENFGED